MKLPDDKLWAAIAGRIEQQTNGCWLWNGAHTKAGYSIVHVPNTQNKVAYVHRFMCARFHGESNLNAIHTCENSRCISPEHLKWGNQKENMRRYHQGPNARAWSRRGNRKIWSKRRGY